jgi:hypothetical protein
MSKRRGKIPESRDVQRAAARRDANSGAQKRKLLQKHYNNKYHVR